MLSNILARVEKARLKYPHIDDGELQRRRDAVQGLRTDLAAIKTAMGARQLQSKIDADAKAVRGRGLATVPLERCAVPCACRGCRASCAVCKC